MLRSHNITRKSLRLLLLLVLPLMFLSCEGEAQQEQTPLVTQRTPPPKGDKRTEFRNDPPQPTGWVTDFDSVFTPEQEKKLSSMIEAFEKETGMEIAVLTLDTNYVAKDSVYTLVYQIFTKWGIGKKEKNNGLIVAICRNYGMFRITTGTGTQQIMSDKEAEKIMNEEFFPKLRENKFYDAFNNGIGKLIAFLKPRAGQIK